LTYTFSALTTAKQFSVRCCGIRKSVGYSCSLCFEI